MQLHYSYIKRILQYLHAINADLFIKDIISLDKFASQQRERLTKKKKREKAKANNQHLSNNGGTKKEAE